MLDKMLNKADEIIKRQAEISLKIKSEICEDIHSVLRTKSHIESYLELEIKKNLLMDLISKYEG